MLSTYEIKISFLKLLKRLPTENEINTDFSTLSELQDFLTDSQEYKLLHDIFSSDTVYDLDQNTITISNITGDYDQGIYLCNTYLTIETSTAYNKPKSSYIYDFLLTHKTVNLLDISFFDNIYNITNHTQQIDMNNCCIHDTFNVNDVGVHITKYVLQTYKTCVLQKITLTSPVDKEIAISHNLEQQDSFNTFVIDLNDVHMYFSELCTKDIITTTLYNCESTISHKGYNIVDGIVQNKFSIDLVAEETVELYVLTSCMLRKDINLVTNVKILTDTQRHSMTELIANHVSEWSKKWTTRFTIKSKQSIDTDQIDDIHKFGCVLNHALFTIYNNPMRTDQLFVLPILTMLQPELAKNVISQLHLHYQNYGRDIAEMYGKRGIFYNLLETPSLSHHNRRYLHEIALLSINTWNYFRQTKDTYWLQNIGYSILKHNAEYITSVINNNTISDVHTFDDSKKMNDNAMTNHFCNLALQYTNHALYELNYVPVQKFADTLAVNTFDQNSVVSVTDTNLHIKVEEISGVYHYVFYDSQNNALGYRFGGDSGYRLQLANDANVVINLDTSLEKFPIIFTDSNNSNVEILDGKIEILSNGLKSYQYDNNSVFAIFKENFNNNYGENAFITQSITNIIKPYQDYGFQEEIIPIIEPYIVLNNFFNNNVSLDKLKDNTTYYDKLYENNPFNALLYSGMEGNIAQLETKYERKRASANMFFNITKSINYGEPWCNNDFAVMLVFIVLTSLFKFSFQGERTPERFLSSPYGLKFDTKNVLPNVMANISINSYTINNTLYTDDPFDIILDGIQFIVSLNEIEQKVTITVDLQRIGTNVENLTILYMLQELDDLTEYTSILTHDDATSETNIFVIDYSDYVLKDTFQIDDSTKPIDPLHGRVLNVYIEHSGKNKLIRKVFDRLYDPIVETINPTVHAVIDYESPNFLVLNMHFDSQYQHSYYKFENITVDIQFDPTVIDGSGIQYTKRSDEDTIYIDLEESFCEISIITNGFISANYDIGIIKFPLLLSHNVHSNFPLSAVVSSFKVKPMYFTNRSVYPPALFEVNMPDEFAYPPTILKQFANDGLERLKYSPLTFIMSSGNNNYEQIGHDSGIYNEITLRSLQDATEINTFLSEHNKELVDIFGSSFGSIFVLRNTLPSNSILEYHCIGHNYSNMLMIDDSETLEIDDITPCNHLQNFLTEKHLLILANTRSSTLLYCDDKKVYGIGYNITYNLGNGNNQDVNVITESVEINNLINTENSTVKIMIANDKCTLIYLLNNKLYAVGSNTMFLYLCNKNTVTLSTPTELNVINDFLTFNNFIIESIEGGDVHFKFLLKNLETNTQEWWGVGRNRLNSLGVGNLIDPDFDIKHMTRLHQIEQFIHGTDYDPSYKGLSLTNPNEYLVISNDGIPSYHIAILDKITKNIYILGSVNLAEIYEEWTLWIAKEDIEHISPSYYKANNHGIFIGGNHALEIKDYYSKLQNELQYITINTEYTQAKYTIHTHTHIHIAN